MSHEPPTDHGHLSREMLDGYFVGRYSLRELGHHAVAHLLDHCPECRRRMQPVDVATCFEQGATGAAKRLRDERESLWDLLEELLPLSHTETLVGVTVDRRFATLAFAQHQVEIASLAFEQGDLEVAQEANRLAGLVAHRLDPGRYGRASLAWLDAERRFLHARIQAIEGDVAQARGWWRSGRRNTSAAGSPPSLLALQHLTGAEIRLAAGQVHQATAFARAAAEIVETSEIDRWRWSIARVTARLERLQARPAAAVACLRPLLGSATPRGPLAWSVARELTFALLEADELPEAAARVAMWWSQAAGDSPETPAEAGEGLDHWIAQGWRDLGADATDLLMLLGGLERRRGRLHEARILLERAREALLARRRGADAIAATVELLRVLDGCGERDRLASVSARLKPFATCDDVPRRVLRALAEYGAAVCQGRVGDLDSVERAVLLHLGAPIDHPPHGSS